MAQAEAKSKNPITRSSDFVRESITELKKVHTPTRQETIMLTMRVFFLLCLFGMFLGMTDGIVGFVMKQILTDPAAGIQ